MTYQTLMDYYYILSSSLTLQYRLKQNSENINIPYAMIALHLNLEIGYYIRPRTKGMRSIAVKRVKGQIYVG